MVQCKQCEFAGEHSVDYGATKIVEYSMQV